MDQQDLIQKNLEAEIFTVPIVADELQRMWETRREQVRHIAREMAANKPTNIVFFGSGGSACALYSGYYSVRRYCSIPASYLISPEIVAARPAILDQNAVAIGASYSGKTVDTMAAKQCLQQRGVPMLAITRKPDAELAAGAAWSLTYESRALFSSPAFLTMLLTVELCRARSEWSPEVESFEQALSSLPILLRDIAESSRQLAERNAPELDARNIMVLAGGGSYSLGYMMAYDMFGEYLKQHCSFIHYGEFRHGPLEIVRPGEPTMMILLGNDGSRHFGETTLNFAQKHKARVVVFDAAELAPGAHPMVDPFVLYLSQLWLLYHMACRRRLDLDHYSYMHVVPYAERDTFY